MDIQHLQYHLETLCKKADKLGKFDSVSTTCLTIPTDLYNEIQDTWKLIKAIDPSYTRLR